MILDCYTILKQFETNPALRTGEENLGSIHIYIAGYYHALLDNRVVQSPHTVDPFHDWVADKLGFKESTAGWVNMILAYCVGYESTEIEWEEFLAAPITKEQHLKSIELFYLLLEEFKMEVDERTV